MTFLLVSFFAGILTVLAPCVFPLLPVIIGGSVSNDDKKRPLVIIGSLAFFIILFTVLLKFGEGIFSIPDMTLRIISGLILIIFGLSSLFPKQWGILTYKLGITSRSDQFLHESSGKRGWLGEILTGAALGPVFTSCSPTYLVILGLALQEQNFFTAFLYLVFYVLGLCFILLLVSIWGQRIIKKLKWATNPNSKFKKIIGIIFIVVGLIIIFRIEKEIQEVLLQVPFFENFYSAETDIINQVR